MISMRRAARTCLAASVLLGSAAVGQCATIVTYQNCGTTSNGSLKCSSDQLAFATSKMKEATSLLVLGAVVDVEAVRAKGMRTYMALVTMNVEQHLAGAACGDTLQFYTANAFVPCVENPNALCVKDSASRPWVLAGDRIVVVVAPHEINNMPTGHLRDLYVGFLKCSSPTAVTDTTSIYAEYRWDYDGRSYARDAAMAYVDPYDYLMVTRERTMVLGDVINMCRNGMVQEVVR